MSSSRSADDQWRAFSLDIPASEKCVLAEFNPDISQDNVIVVTESLRVRWYDVSKTKMSKKPMRAVDPPRGIERKATCAVLFEPPHAHSSSLLDGNLRDSSSKADGAAAADDAQDGRGVRFASDRDSADVDGGGAASPSPAQQDPPIPVGAIGTNDGSIMLFAEDGFTCAFKLSHGQAARQIVVLEQPQLMLPSTAADATPAEPEVSFNRPDFTGANYAPSNATEVELDTQVGSPTAPAYRSSDPADQQAEWLYTIAVLDAEGGVAVLQPVIQGANFADGDVTGARDRPAVVTIQSTVFRPFISLTGVKAIAGSSEGAVFLGGRGNSRDVMCVPGNVADKDDGMTLQLPPSFRRVKAMDAFRHVLYVTRGSELFQCDFRARTVSLLCDIGSTGVVVHSSYPAVFVGCDNGAIFVVSVLAKAVIAQTVTFSQGVPVSLRYCWERCVLVVTDETGGAELLGGTAKMQAHIRGPLSRLAAGRVLRRSHQLESAPASLAARASEALVLERFVVPPEALQYMSRAVAVA